jgi:hypothetical protein
VCERECVKEREREREVERGGWDMPKFLQKYAREAREERRSNGLKSLLHRSRCPSIGPIEFSKLTETNRIRQIVIRT